MGKNNVQLREEKNTAIQHWGLRKLSVGVASVLLGTTAYLGMGSGVVVHADTIPSNNNASTDVAVDSKGAMSQGLYQSDDIQTDKEQASANDGEMAQVVNQTVNRDVTNSKNNNNVTNVNSSNNQDVQLGYQTAKQSAFGPQEVNPYVVLAANLNTNYSSNAQLENINLTGWSANYKDLSADKTITIDTSQANTRIGFDGKFRLSADQLNKAGSIKLFSIVQTSDTNAYNSITLENNDSAFVLDGKTLGYYHLDIDERTADAKDFNPKFKRLTLSLVIDHPLGNASGNRELNVNVPWIGTMSWSAPYAFRGNYTYSNNVLSIQGQGLYGSYRKDYHIRYYKSPNSQSVINGQSDSSSYIHLLPQSGVTASGKMSLVLDAKYIGWTDPNWVRQFLNNHGTGSAINLNQYVEHAARYSVDGQSLIINASDQPSAVVHYGNMPAFNSVGQIYGDQYVDAQTIGAELGKESSITIFPPNTSMLTMKNSGKLGYLVSQQDDGSVICYVKIPLSDFRLQDSQKQSVINSIIYTSQRLNKDASNDTQALQIANQWVNRWINGSLKGVPLNVSEGGPIVRLTSPFSHTTIHAQQLNINTGQPITGQDFITTNNINDAKANGQLEIQVHYINDKTGAEIAQTKDFVAWPSDAKAISVDIPSLDHYTVVKDLDGQTTLRLANGTFKALKGSIISNGNGLNYGSLSENNGVKHYYVVYHRSEVSSVADLKVPWKFTDASWYNSPNRGKSISTSQVQFTIEKDTDGSLKVLDCKTISGLPVEYSVQVDPVGVSKSNQGQTYDHVITLKLIRIDKNPWFSVDAFDTTSAYTLYFDNGFLGKSIDFGEVSANTLIPKQQPVLIEYTDESGKVIKKQSLTDSFGLGVLSGADFAINNYQAPDGYKITNLADLPHVITRGLDNIMTWDHSSQRPSSVIYSLNDGTNTSDHKVHDETIQVKIAPILMPIDPDKPASWPKDSKLSTNDFHKMVRRTVHFVLPHGSTPDVIQSVAYIRSATYNEVTKQVVFGDWRVDGNETMPEVAAIDVEGYKANNIAPEIKVEPSMQNSLVTITYSPLEQSVNWQFIDDDKSGKVLRSGNLIGKTDETVNTGFKIPANYIVVGVMPSTYQFKANGNQTIVVHFKHYTKASNRDVTVTRTIHYVGPNDLKLHDDTVQSLIFHQTGRYDAVTGQTTWDAVPDQKFAAVLAPSILGYVPAVAELPALDANVNSDKNEEMIRYNLADEALNINFVDSMGNAIAKSVVRGKYGQTIDVHSVLPAGWQLYAGQIVPDAVKLGTYNADLAFILDHKIAEIKPEMNVSTTTVIPRTNHLTYPSEALSSNLNRDLVYTVKVKDSDGKVESKVFKQHVSRSAYLDLVTGKVVGYSKWTNNGQHTFNAFVAQPKDGYTINTLPAVTLDVDHPTKTVEVSYVPKVVTGQVVYKTFDGQTIDTQAFTGTSAVNLTAPAGYRLSTEVTSLHPANENGQTYIVYVVPQVTTYTSSSADKPANIGDLFKTVTRTINIKLVNGRTRTIKQLVRFERTARVDANGKVTYSNWQSIGRNKFNAVYVPKRMGYHVVIKQDGKVLPKVDQVVDISADANDSVINVEYLKN